MKLQMKVCCSVIYKYIHRFLFIWSIIGLCICHRYMHLLTYHYYVECYCRPTKKLYKTIKKLNR